MFVKGGNFMKKAVIYSRKSKFKEEKLAYAAEYYHTHNLSYTKICR